MEETSGLAAPEAKKTDMQRARDEKRFGRIEISEAISKDAVDACMLLQARMLFIEVKFNYFTKSFIVTGCAPEFEAQEKPGIPPWYQAQFHEERDPETGAVLECRIEFVKSPGDAAAMRAAKMKEHEPKKRDVAPLATIG